MNLALIIMFSFCCLIIILSAIVKTPEYKRERRRGDRRKGNRRRIDFIL